MYYSIYKITKINTFFFRSILYAYLVGQPWTTPRGCWLSRSVCILFNLSWAKLEWLKWDTSFLFFAISSLIWSSAFKPFCTQSWSWCTVQFTCVKFNRFIARTILAPLSWTMQWTLSAISHSLIMHFIVDWITSPVWLPSILSHLSIKFTLWNSELQRLVPTKCPW